MANQKKNGTGALVLIAIICVTLFGAFFTESARAGGGPNAQQNAQRLILFQQTSGSTSS
ncbi:MAG: hypothetical protein IPM23_13460 [Candidatus Melainabacteria bacterium]|nr:hypothetical protein [Candidatus Melainabacteria bacterium]